MHTDIETVIHDAAAIQDRIAALGHEITQRFQGEDLVLLALLKGSVIFLADLVRRIELPMQMEFVVASSYGDATVSSGTVRLGELPVEQLTGKSVLVVDDILDSGRTLHAVGKTLREQCSVKSVHTCVLLDKDTQRAEELEADFAGFRVDDVFVVGFGLDYRGEYRNLPYIGVLKEEVYGGK